MSLSPTTSVSSLQDPVKDGLEVQTLQVPLSEYVSTIATMPLEDAVAATSDLMDQLGSYISCGGKRCVKHPKYKGTANLNHLARIWMDQGSRCCGENASFPLRLKQYSLLPRFQQLYIESNRGVKKSIVGWLFTPFRDFRLGCGCCSRDPLFCVPFGEGTSDALFVQREIHEKYWPAGNRKSVYSHWYSSDARQLEVTYVKVMDLEDIVARDRVRAKQSRE